MVGVCRVRGRVGGRAAGVVAYQWLLLACGGGHGLVVAGAVGGGVEFVEDVVGVGTGGGGGWAGGCGGAVGGAAGIGLLVGGAGAAFRWVGHFGGGFGGCV